MVQPLWPRLFVDVWKVGKYGLQLSCSGCTEHIALYVLAKANVGSRELNLVLSSVDFGLS